MAQTRPNEYLNWTDGSPSKVVEPPGAFKLAGWLAGQAPPATYTNWQIWLIDQWIKYFDQVLNTGLPDNVIRLLNGGYWDFNLATQTMSWDDVINLAVPGVPDANNAVAAGSIVLPDGYLAYVNINDPSVSVGDTANGVDLIENMNFTGNISIGDTVTGLGIPNGTTVVDVFDDSVQISNPANSDNNQQQYIFSATGALTLLTALSSTFIPTIADIVVARRQGAIIYVGVNSSQMVLRDNESKKLMQDGYVQYYQILAGQALTAGQIVYISQGSMDGGRTQGAAYPLDCSPPQAELRSGFVGFVTTSVAQGAQANIVFSGFFPKAGITAGLIYYADPSVPGGLTTTKPLNIAIPIAIAINGTTLLINNASIGSGTNPVSNFFYEEPIGVGNGTTTDFLLTQRPLDQQSIAVFANNQIVELPNWQLIGTNTIRFASAPAVAVKIVVQYALYAQGLVAGHQEKPTDSVNGTNATFHLVGNPNPESLFVFLDQGLVLEANYTFIADLTGTRIVFNTAPSPGQSVYFLYWTEFSSPGPVFQPDSLGVGDGSTVLFNLTKNPLDQASIFLFANDLNVPDTAWDLAGRQITFHTAPAAGVVITAQYLLKDQGVLIAHAQVPDGAVNSSNTVFTLDAKAPNKESLFLWIDGTKVDGADYTLVQGINNTDVVFTVAPATGQQLFSKFFSVGPGSGPGGINIVDAENIGTGIGIYKMNASGVLQFKKINEGANITIVDNGNDITISATGGGGGGTEFHPALGQAGTPITFDPTMGLTPTSASDQVYILKTSSGAQNVTAGTQIANGVIVGQRLTLIGYDSANYYIFNDGANLSLNGACAVTNNQALKLIWNGVVWYEECGRRS